MKERKKIILYEPQSQTKEKFKHVSFQARSLNFHFQPLFELLSNKMREMRAALEFRKCFPYT